MPRGTNSSCNQCSTDSKGGLQGAMRHQIHRKESGWCFISIYSLSFNKHYVISEYIYVQYHIFLLPALVTSLHVPSHQQKSTGNKSQTCLRGENSLTSWYHICPPFMVLFRFYFSDRNLSRDLRIHEAAVEGWLNTSWLLQCPKLRRQGGTNRFFGA